MRIQEVEPLVGITKKNLRFYESEGLLHPKRDGTNGYRDYSEADVALLRKIKLLRSLDIPLEEIRQLQAGTLTVSDAMELEAVRTRREQKNLEVRQALLKELAREQIPLDQLDPDPWLSEIEHLKEKGVRFMDQKRDVKRQAVAPVIAALVMMLMMGLFLGIMIWGQTEDPIPLPLWWLTAAIPLAVCAGVIIALVSRIRELRTGEEEESRKY